MQWWKWSVESAPRDPLRARTAPRSVTHTHTHTLEEVLSVIIEDCCQLKEDVPMRVPSFCVSAVPRTPPLPLPPPPSIPSPPSPLPTLLLFPPLFLPSFPPPYPLAFPPFLPSFPPSLRYTVHCSSPFTVSETWTGSLMPSILVACTAYIPWSLVRRFSMEIWKVALSTDGCTMSTRDSSTCREGGGMEEDGGRRMEGGGWRGGDGGRRMERGERVQ